MLEFSTSKVVWRGDIITAPIDEHKVCFYILENVIAVGVTVSGALLVQDQSCNGNTREATLAEAIAGPVTQGDLALSELRDKLHTLGVRSCGCQNQRNPPYSNGFC